MSSRLVWCTFICIWILEVPTVVQSSDDLLVRKGQSLKIDTKNLQLNHSFGVLQGIVFTLKPANCTAMYSEDADVALLKTNGNIIFERGSQINITGNRSLAIESKQQNIIINTTIDMTCKNYENGSQRCLGSYLEDDIVDKTNGGKRYLIGKGPQWKKVQSEMCSRINDYDTKCIPGASHGGIGGTDNTFNSHVTSYGMLNFTCMDGGSIGITRSQGACVGGGAIEIKAENGKITIGEAISASAAILNSSMLFTGCSGGLIRLIASKVEMKNGGSLRVDGANASMIGLVFDDGRFAGNGGGGGGIIQIIAPKGTVRNISLKGGKNNKCYQLAKQPSDGVFIIKNSRDHTNYTNHSSSSFVKNSSEIYTWGIEDEKPTSVPTDVTTTQIPVSDLDSLSKELIAIRVC